MKEQSIFDGLKGLHPFAQVIIPIVVGGIICVAIWQFFSLMKKEIKG